MRPLQEIAELRLLFFCLELILVGVLTRRYKDYGLIQSRQAFYSLLAFHYPVPQGRYSVVLVLAFLHVPIRNRAGCVGQSMEVEDDLIPGLPFMDVVNGEVEVVGSDGALGTLVHQYQNKMSLRDVMIDFSWMYSGKREI